MTSWMVLDFETYYDKDYSLSKMTTANYIVHPYFEALGAAVKINGQRSMFVEGPDLEDFFVKVDWADTYLIAHNMMFDGTVLKWHYGHAPKMYLDTMGMAQALVFPYTGSASLAKVAEHLGVGKKGSFITNAKGKRRADFTDAEWREYVSYARNDADLEWDIFLKLAKGYPSEEFRVMDITARMFIDPQLALDRDTLERYAVELEEHKAKLLEDAHLADRSALMSNDRFAALLQMLGVSPPQKISPRTGKRTWAFAKTDIGMQNLLEDDNAVVQALCAARLGHKSTIEQTRTQRFIDIADHHKRLPAPLRYYAAHTGRYGGTDKINLQNLKRGGELRRAIKARKGHVIVSVDASQIEARLLATVAGQHDLVAGFARGDDIYSEFATDLYGYPVAKPMPERHVGKTSILGLGYGMGDTKFYATVRKDRPDIDTGTCGKAVYLYRAKYTAITGLWNKADRAIPLIKEPYEVEFCDGLLVLGNGKARLPNDMYLHYNSLEWALNEHKGKEGWRYKFGKMYKDLYGPKFVENIIQAMARIHIFSVMVELHRMGIRTVLQVHDELVFHVREADAEDVRDTAIEVMSRPPRWLPHAPLAAEGGIGPNFLEAK